MSGVAIVELSNEVPGFAELVEYCNGSWPCFHDAEVVHLHVNRTGVSHLSIEVGGFHQRTTKFKQDAIVADWHLCLGPPQATLITFVLEEIDELQLDGFNFQNVISDVSLEKVELGFRLKLWPCYGISGSLHAGKVRIEFAPARVE